MPPSQKKIKTKKKFAWKRSKSKGKIFFFWKIYKTKKNNKKNQNKTNKTKKNEGSRKDLNVFFSSRLFFPPNSPPYCCIVESKNFVREPLCRSNNHCLLVSVSINNKTLCRTQTLPCPRLYPAKFGPIFEKKTSRFTIDKCFISAETWLCTSDKTGIELR